MLGGSGDEGAADILRVLPLPALLRPHGLGHVLRGHDEGALHGEVVPQVLGEDGEGSDGLALAEPHPKQERAVLVAHAELIRLLLVRVGLVNHADRLLSSRSSGRVPRAI